MQMPANKVIVFNVAAGLVTIGALLAVVRSAMFSPTDIPCSERYASSTMFALERAGVMLSAADLQAGLGGRDAGLIDNVAIARVKGAPAPIAIGVSLPKGSASPHGTSVLKGGMSFPWQPRSIQAKSAACLGYGVLLPADFDFHRGGVLPGIGGADGSEGGEGFLAQLAWRAHGLGGVTHRVTNAGEARGVPVEREGFTLTRGRWIKLEQEVVLNTPKKADGILRVWVDGRIALDRSDMTYRATPDVLIWGVAAELFYGREDAIGAAPKDAKVWLTPFELRWQ